MTRKTLVDRFAQCDPSAPYAGEVWPHVQPVGREFGTRAAILVVDLEATCSDTDPAFDMETIEIGACWVDVGSRHGEGLRTGWLDARRHTSPGAG
jgi:hypothetical protein